MRATKESRVAVNPTRFPNRDVLHRVHSLRFLLPRRILAVICRPQMPAQTGGGDILHNTSDHHRMYAGHPHPPRLHMQMRELVTCVMLLQNHVHKPETSKRLVERTRLRCKE